MADLVNRHGVLASAPDELAERLIATGDWKLAKAKRAAAKPTEPLEE